MLAVHFCGLIRIEKFGLFICSHFKMSQISAVLVTGMFLFVEQSAAACCIRGETLVIF